MVVLAQEQARLLTHNYIGTEHILLGLLGAQEGLAARVLESLEITIDRVRAQVVRMVGSGEEITSGQIPFTPRAKKVLQLARREALSLGHDYIGTEHILLGLTQENEGVAIRILLALEADAEKIRNETLRMLSGPEARQRAEVTRRWTGVDPGVLPIDQAWFDGLGTFLDGLTFEIRRELKREPDTGDLLLTLGHAPDTLAGQALRELGVDLDELPGMINRIRAQAGPTEEDRIEKVRRSKELALELQQFEIAARLRDEERRRTIERNRSQEAMRQEIRRHIGIPARPENPPQQPEQS